MRRDLPTGTVTFLFTDIEGSTRLLHEVGAEAYAAALAEHRHVMRDAFHAHGGVEVDTQGDAFFVSFPTAAGALAAAAQVQERLAAGPVQVRMGVHTGTPHVTDEGYVGADVHRAARIAAAGHGRQVLVSAATATLVGTAALTDLGPHRLKDLSAPERIYQLGADAFPRLRTLYQTNLPTPSTPFVGRARELREVSELLAANDVRLLTLTGPGGTGKTRLALHAAGAAADAFPHGVWWVPLAALRDHTLVIEAAAHALGTNEDLARHIADKRLLLVFDNFEQVVTAATDVAVLLERCPRLAVLVTTREPLRLSAEREFAVEPLARADAVALFDARARAIRRDAALNGDVPRICAALDDLPLAIELAAARVKVMSPAQILERLEHRLPLLVGGARDLPERQRTLRAAIEWSHELLATDEQRLFATLSVFRGGCTLDAAEAVAGADVDAMQSLADKSLLRHRDERFSMLETIREYAAERFESSNDADAMRRRHADHYYAMTIELEAGVRRLAKSALDLVDREHDNVRAALDHFRTTGETERVQRMAGALARFWVMKGHLREAARRLDAALRADERPTYARARALVGIALTLSNSGAADECGRRAEEALALHQRLGDAAGAAESILCLAASAGAKGDMKTAQRLYEESRRGSAEAGDDHLALLASRALAWTYGELGDSDRARAMHEENLARARTIGNVRIEAESLGALGNLAIDDGRSADALALFDEADRAYRDLGDTTGMAVNVCRFARGLAHADRFALAARLLASYEARREELGLDIAWVAEMNEATFATIRARLDDAELAQASEEGGRLSVDEALAMARESSAVDGALGGLD